MGSGICNGQLPASLLLCLLGLQEPEEQALSLAREPYELLAWVQLLCLGKMDVALEDHT